MIYIFSASFYEKTDARIRRPHIVIFADSEAEARQSAFNHIKNHYPDFRKNSLRMSFKRYSDERIIDYLSKKGYHISRLLVS